jgi:hypothetical protein
MKAFCLAVIVAFASQPALAAEKKPEKSEFLSPKEVEAEGKGALVTVLAYFAESDNDLKKLLEKRSDLAAKIKRFEDSGDAPNSLEKAKKDLSATKEAVLKQQVKLVVGMVPADQFDTLQAVVKRLPDARFVIRPKTKEEGAKNAAFFCSGLIQFMDKDHRDVLKRVHDVMVEKGKAEKTLKDADDPIDKEKLQKKLKDLQAKIESDTKAATESRHALIRRLIDELNEGRGVPPVKLHPVFDKD